MVIRLIPNSLAISSTKIDRASLIFYPSVNFFGQKNGSSLIVNAQKIWPINNSSGQSIIFFDSIPQSSKATLRINDLDFELNLNFTSLNDVSTSDSF